jgi:RNA ligase
MLAVQEFLARHGLQELKEKLAIEVVEHPAEPLVILNYNQINSPKGDPVVRECRGLTLEKGSWQVVAKSFDRFFNWGEMAHEARHFDWSDFLCQTKEDGSLILIYQYRGQWRVNTRGSFGMDVIHSANAIWRDVVLGRLGDPSVLDPSLTYICELTSPLNQVVRKYPATELFLLTTFHNHPEGPRELPDEETASWSGKVGLPRPRQHHFRSESEIRDFLRAQQTADPTFEGVVVRDRHNHRWKIKNRSYLCYKGVVDEHGQTDNPKLFLPFILNGEDSEFLAYFPQVTGAYNACKERVEEAYEQLRELWLRTRAIVAQKEFAQAVQKASPFAGLLFALRKRLPPAEQTEKDLFQLWQLAEPQILDWLKKHGRR